MVSGDEDGPCSIGDGRASGELDTRHQPTKGDKGNAAVRKQCHRSLFCNPSRRTALVVQ